MSQSKATPKLEVASDEYLKGLIKTSMSFGTGLITHVKTECKQDGYLMPSDQRLFNLTIEVVAEEKAASNV